MSVAATIAIYFLYAALAYAGIKTILVLFGLYGPIYFLGEMYFRSELKKHGIKNFIGDEKIRLISKEIISETIRSAPLFKHNPRSQMMKELEHLALTLYMWIRTNEDFDEESVWAIHKELIIRFKITRNGTAA